jgi:hypothetical protein
LGARNLTRENSMPHISTGGVTNQIVDPDFVAPPGVPVEQAMDEGMPDQGKPDETEPDTREEDSAPGKDEDDKDKDDKDAGRGPRPQGDNWDPAKPAVPAKSAAPAKKK